MSSVLYRVLSVVQRWCFATIRFFSLKSHTLPQALENEFESFREVALKRGYADYIELARISSITILLAQTYDASSAKLPELDRQSPHFKRQLFGEMLEACSALRPRDGKNPDSQEFITGLQAAVRKTQDGLRDSIPFADTSELKQHLIFFEKAFAVLLGDVATIERLEARMDDCLT